VTVRPLSARNPRVQRLTRLVRRREERAEQRAFVVEGPVLVASAIDAGAPILDVYVGEDHADRPTIAAVIDRLLRAVPRTTPVYWLNVQNQPNYPAHPESVNDALAAAQSRWPNLTLVDMSARFRNHPEWHLPDGLRFSPAGSDQLAKRVTQSLEAAR